MQYKLIRLSDAPKHIQRLAQSLLRQEQPQQSLAVWNEKAYLLITFGRRRTGGYSATVRKVHARQDGSVEVVATLRRPAPGSIVTQVLTHPTLIIQFDRAEIRRFHVIREEI